MTPQEEHVALVAAVRELREHLTGGHWLDETETGPYPAILRAWCGEDRLDDEDAGGNRFVEQWETGALGVLRRHEPWLEAPVSSNDPPICTHDDGYELSNPRWQDCPEVQVVREVLIAAGRWDQPESGTGRYES